MSIKLNEARIYEKWIPALKKKFEAEGYSVSEKRLKKVAEMCHTRKMFEARAELGSTVGRGGISLGNNPQDGLTGFYGTRGSAEVFQNLFGVFTEVAALNVGLEMLPMVPQGKSGGTIYIAEPVYADGRMESATDKPIVFHVKQNKNGAPTALVVGTTYTVKTANTGGENICDVIFVGFHRINGNFVFKTGQFYDNTGGGGTNWKLVTIGAAFSTTGAGIYNSAVNYFSFDGTTADYVAGFSNVITGFSGAGKNDTDAWAMNRGDGNQYGQPMSRPVAERSNYRSMGIRTWSRNFTAETVHVDLELTTEQIQDMEMDHNISAMEFGDSILQDQLNQHINEHILGEMFAHGWEHHWEINRQNGFNMNTFLGPASSTGSSKSFLGKDGSTTRTIAGAAGVLPSTGAISENLSSLQRRVITRLLYASGVINNRSRRGKGDQAVLNTTFATAIRDIKGFTPAPFANDINDSGLYFLGTLYGIKIYEDPLMELSDPRINVSRRGNEKDPGLKFCPYILAEKITTIAEATMSPKTALKSRYSVVPCGTYPELNYMTFIVEGEANGYSIV